VGPRTDMASAGNRGISVPARNQTDSPVDQPQPSHYTNSNCLIFTKAYHWPPPPPSSSSHLHKIQLKVRSTKQSLPLRVTNQHTRAFISPPATFSSHLILLDDDDDNLYLLSLYVFGTAILMIHVKQTHANSLFTHFTLNEQVEAVSVWGGA
jgi:hypothetical protein